MISVGNPVASPTMQNTIKSKTPETDSRAKNPAETGYKKITGGQIKDILATPQVVRSDCYLVSTLKSLAKSRMGKQMLKQSIKTSPDGDSFEVTFNKYDKNNTYKIEHDEKYNVVSGRNKFNPTGAVETATNFVVQDRKDSKPTLIRIFGPLCCGESPLECNLASKYMENLTGRKPISLGDDSLRPLSSKKEEATKLLDEIGSQTMNHHSFVAGSKLMNTKDGIGTKHYYVLQKVDKNKKEVYLVNPRYADFSKDGIEEEFNIDLLNDGCPREQLEQNKNSVKNMPKVYKLSYDQFMNNFRSIVGYFDDKVMKNKK